MYVETVTMVQIPMYIKIMLKSENRSKKNNTSKLK